MSLGDADIRAIAALMRDVACAEIMPRFGRIGPADLRTKAGPLDPVTIADEAAERALIAGLERLFPGAAIIGEEAVSADPALIDRVREPKPVFAIDPIDGTQNYAAGLPLFGVMIALIENGTTTAGLIHDPLRDDTVVARAGGGAFLLLRDGATTRLRVADPVPLDRTIASVSWQYMSEPERSRVLRNLARLGQTPNLRCAAATYRAIAMGHIHATLSRRTLPWDHAAGALIVAEAGGHVRKPDGEPWRPAELDGGILAAQDEESWHLLREALFDSEAA
ncbi:inositol monophosphatase family protein [Acidiphilium iwatense]|uniref:Inositol monophosphatase n=1 Tax=Acidiphilium iwatense TaxID=768198 RepID=A0ABS9DSD5_9PROT|nr:inositol monophosphatase family protein [Acidiphilium iwatense]MCF3945607.1 inositol monophosphatase [Acidiphilium iwatense]